MRPQSQQEGYILLPVVIIITLVAIVAFMMNMEAAVETGSSNKERDAHEARYVAEAGLQHALWQMEQAGCGPYTDLTGQAFGDHGYNASITPNQSGGTIITTIVQVGDDAYISEDAPTQNYGSDGQLQVLNVNNNLLRALYRFDLESAGISSGSTILSALIYLFVIDPDDSDVVNVHRVTSDWDESTVIWDSAHDQYDPAVQAVIPKSPSTGDYVGLNVTALVQGWVNGTVENQGIMLIPNWWFDMSQYTSKEYGNVDQRPYLEVVTTDGSLSTRADIRATGTLANGTEQTLTRDDVVLYQPASTLTWQLGPELKDAFVWDGAHQDVNFGISPILNIKNDRNVLIQFPMEALPPGARVVDATLDLYLKGGAGVIDGQLDLHRISRDWVEGTYDDVNPPAGGGVTYNDYDGGNAWTTRGGDYDADIIDRVILPSMVPGWYTWHVTGQVQAWLYGQANYGFLLREGGGDAGDIDFVSSDDTTTSEYRPRLNITLACECGQACQVPQGSGRILVVVRNPWNLTYGESILLGLFEAWGYTYSLIQQDDSQGNFDAAAATHDVAFISESVNSTDVDDKLTDFHIGVVSAESALNDELGISTDYDVAVGQNILVTDTTHDITAIFPMGILQFKQYDTELHIVSGTLAPGAQVLAEYGGAATLVALDQGADMAGGGTAAGRRVMIPLAGDAVNPYLTNNGQLIIQRAIEWAKPLNCSDGDYADDFDTAGFNNNDGSLLWGSDWVEVDGDGAGAGSGNVRITAGRLELDDNPETFGQPGVTRTFNLQGATMALLDLDFELDSRTDQGSDVALLEISTDGTTWDVLEDFSIFSGRDTGHRTYNLSAYLVADVQIRLRIESGYSAADEALFIDNLVVSVCGTLENPPSTEPVAHWPLDETSGPTAQDIEGGHDGDLTDGPVWTPGQIEGGLSFDGSDDYINVPHQDTLSFSTFTISAWVKPAALNGYRVIVSKGTAADLNYYLGTNNNEISFGFLNVGVWTEFNTTGAGLAINNWYHLTGTFDDAIGEAKMYLNGVLLHTATTTASPPACNDDLMIGTTVFNEFWSGLLDDVRIYDRVLGGSEVADLFVGGSAPPIDADYVDQFNAVGYNNSDGSQDWTSSPWTEISDDGAAGSGLVQVTNDRLELINTDFGDLEGVVRGADLSVGSPTTAVLSFDYGGFGEGGEDAFGVQISDNSGGTWHALEKIAVVGAISDSRSYSLHDYISLTSDFMLKLHIFVGFGGPGQYLFVDNVVIDLDPAGGGGGCDGNYADAFTTRTFSGSDGSLAWTGDWQEVGEVDGPTAGDIGVGTDMSDFQLRLQDNDNGGEGVERQVDLSNAGSAGLTFSYRREGLDLTTDFAKVEISANGTAGPWIEIARFQGPGTDTTYQSYKLDISSYASANTRIRFITSPTMGDRDRVWFDDVEITCNP
jgi:concanavalin A-like lectin/glucanase superfamily protein